MGRLFATRAVVAARRWAPAFRVYPRCEHVRLGVALLPDSGQETEAKVESTVHFRSLGLRRAKKIFLLDVEAAVMGRKYSVSARNIFAFEWEISNVRVKGRFFFFGNLIRARFRREGKRKGIGRFALFRFSRWQSPRSPMKFPFSDENRGSIRDESICRRNAPSNLKVAG